ncbi:hypothetical protein [Demequina sp.]|uniref:hypothetical protein n=1 Tax=Demequina sp. TaxID=2050685 RepID=UPI0025C4FBF2|nr:hypothetical protein [Demequina sp.]
MFKFNLKALLARGSDEGFYAPGSGPPQRGLPRERVDAVEFSEADRAPNPEAPMPMRGFGSSANWGVW